MPVASGNARRTIERTEDEQLERRAVENHPEGRSAVIEDHDLVDHGQFQMRVGIVEGNAPVLHQQAR